MRADRASYYGLSGLEPQSQACQKTRADRFLFDLGKEGSLTKRYD
jgi:hypothetical protein